ncbi:hypothetical protein [Sphaerisporangium sp. NPDC051011]|uniref:hypothetical protein n=1 Tax=Sphaerisporangium sp. NPDC051011 TaxID=3155792 RepID=UPI0033CBA0DB
MLTWLAWGLRQLERTTVLVARRHGEPVLYVVRADGRKVAVLAVEHGDQWFFVWGPETGVRAEPLPVTVQTIAKAAA